MKSLSSNIMKGLYSLILTPSTLTVLFHFIVFVRQFLLAFCHSSHTKISFVLWSDRKAKFYSPRQTFGDSLFI